MRKVLRKETGETSVPKLLILKLIMFSKCSSMFAAHSHGPDLAFSDNGKAICDARGHSGNARLSTRSPYPESLPREMSLWDDN